MLFLCNSKTIIVNNKDIITVVEIQVNTDEEVSSITIDDRENTEEKPEDQKRKIHQAKLEEAHEILNKAVAMLLKEARVNSFVDGEIFPLPDHVNDEEVLNDLLDIQLKITNLQYKVSNLPVA